jgi:acyl carrier protein
MEDLRQRIKDMLTNELMLEVGADEIGDESPLFGPEGVGLDSVDALQLVVALEKHFGLKIQDQDKAREILKNVQSIAQAIEANGTA